MADESVYRVTLDLRADGTSQVRAVRRVATESTKAADTIDKNTKRIKDDNDEQTSSFEKVEKGAGKLRTGISTLMGTVGFVGLGIGIDDVVKAGQRWQVQQAQLQNALRSTGNASKATVDSVTKATEALAEHGGYSVPQQLSGLNQFLRLTKSTTQAMRDNNLATDMARSGATSFSNAQMVIERALSGSTRGLQRYLGIIEPVKTAEFALTQAHGLNLDAMQQQSVALGKLGPAWLKRQETLHNITPAEMEHAQALDKQATAMKGLSELQSKYGGSTASFSKSTAGSISNAENSLDIAIEKIGKSFLPIVASAARGIASLAELISAHWTQIKRVISSVVDPLIGTIGTLIRFFERNHAAAKAAAVGIGILVGAYAVWKVATTAMTVAQAALNLVLDADPIILIILAIAALAAGLVYAYEKSKTFRDIVQETGRVAKAMFMGLEAIVNATVKFIGAHWKMLAVGGAFFLGGPFLALGIFVATHFALVKHLAEGLVRDISRIFSTVVHAIEWPFEQAWRYITRIFNDIKRTVQSITKIPGSVLGGITGGIGHFLSHPFGFHTGGLVRHMAAGGPIGGYGGGDVIPTMLEPGEYVLNKQAVQNIGIQNLNSLNAGIRPAGAMGNGSSPNEVYVAAPMKFQVGSRILTETVAHFSAKKASLSGGYVSG